MSRPVQRVPPRSPETHEDGRGWALLLAWRRRRRARVRGRTREIGIYERGLWALLVSTAVTCAACGSGSQSSTSRASTTKLPLSAYLVRGQEETGLPPTGRATRYLAATEWTSDIPNGAADAKRLAQEGFREVESVQTGSAKGQGISWAMELGSASAAAREKAAELQEFAYGPQAPGATRFPVAGVPGAEGWGQPDADANILFTEGRCLMLIGAQLASATDNKPPVLAAVGAVWARTHGKPSACAT